MNGRSIVIRWVSTTFRILAGIYVIHKDHRNTVFVESYSLFLTKILLLVIIIDNTARSATSKDARVGFLFLEPTKCRFITNLTFHSQNSWIY